MKLNKKGFTIVELVIVIAVIAILAAVLIPTFNSVISKANESAALQEAKAAESIVILEESGNVNDAVYYYVVYDNAVYKEGAVDTTSKPKYVYIYNGKENKLFENVSDTLLKDGAFLSTGDIKNAAPDYAFLKNDGTNTAKGTNSDLSTKVLVFKVAKGNTEETKTSDCFYYYGSDGKVAVTKTK